MFCLKSSNIKSALRILLYFVFVVHLSMVLTEGISKQHYNTIEECQASECVKKFKGKCNSSDPLELKLFYYCVIECLNLSEIFDNVAECEATGCLSLGLLCLETSKRGKYQCQNTSVGP